MIFERAISDFDSYVIGTQNTRVIISQHKTTKKCKKGT